MSNVKGLDELLKKLDNLQSNQVVKEALTKSCLIVEAEAKERCPYDDGQLKQSITSVVNKNIGAVGTNVEYAPYVHQGTGIYAVNGDGRKDRWSYKDAEGNWHSTIGQHPNPFLETALESKKPKILEIFKGEIRGAIDD